MLLLNGGGVVLNVFAKLVTGLYDSYLWVCRFTASLRFGVWLVVGRAF